MIKGFAQSTLASTLSRVLFTLLSSAVADSLFFWRMAKSSLSACRHAQVKSVVAGASHVPAPGAMCSSIRLQKQA